MKVWIVRKWWTPPDYQPLAHEQVVENLDAIERGLPKKHYDKGRWLTDSVWDSREAAFAYVDAEHERKPTVSILADPWELRT